jgi:hypothetical protein
MEKTLTSEIKKYSKFILNSSLFLFFLICFSVLLISTAQAANLYFLPSSGSYLIGDQFSVGIYVSSTDRAMNAASGTISFSPDKLGVVSISKNETIFTAWVQEPSFSNTSGIINFEGIVLNPGFTGLAGKIITINFKAKAVGDTSLNFSSGSVLANDGKGTNILSNLTGANFSLGFLGPSIPEGAPADPQVSSTTHPDPEKWYSNNHPEFTWELPSDIIGMRLLVDQKSVSIPTIVYSAPFAQRKTMVDMADGVWYFHIQFQNQYGWGGITHFKFKIDTTPPDLFNIEVKEGTASTFPQPTLFFQTRDDTSGIDYYEIIIDKEKPIKIEESEYKLPSQELGKHIIVIKAVDKAGNQTLIMTEINILPIQTPVITDYSESPLPGSVISLKGTARPTSTIRVYMGEYVRGLSAAEEFRGETKSDETGNWSYIGTKPLDVGVYNFWAKAIGPSGEMSEPSEKVTVQVSLPIFIKIGKLAIDYLNTIISLCVLIFIMVSGIIWVWRKIKEKRQILKKEITEAETSLSLSFKYLTKEIRKNVAQLDGKPNLSDREKKIYRDLKKALENSEKIISKEIRDIEKELE